MSPLTLVVAVAKNGAIGRNGDLPWRISDDLKRFKRITSGHAIIMGRKTHDSIGRPLPKRRNMVISRNRQLELEGCEVFETLEAAVDAARSGGDEEPMVIGGGAIYAMALPLATKIELTEVDQTVADADAFFPELDRSGWTETFREPHEGYAFVTLERA